MYRVCECVRTGATLGQRDETETKTVARNEGAERRHGQKSYLG